MSAQFRARPQCINMQAGQTAAIAAGACSTTTDEARASPSRAGRAAGVAAQTDDDPDRHRTEHALHAGPHMVNANRLDPVIPQEPCHPGMMSTLAPLIVESSPGDRELLPVADLAVGHLCDRNAVGSALARVNLAIGSERYAYLHLGRPPRRRWALARHCAVTPILIKTGTTACAAPHS
jgi:hypothetical protein